MKVLLAVFLLLWLVVLDKFPGHKVHRDFRLQFSCKTAFPSVLWHCWLGRESSQ